MSTAASHLIAESQRVAGAHAVEGIEDEQHLLRAFRSFAETAGSLEHYYALLRAELSGLRQELEESHTGLARSLEQNRSIRERLDCILERLPCGVMVVSSERQITHLNPEARRLLGLKEDAGFLAGTVSGLRCQWQEILQASAASEGEREEQILIAPGKTRWLSVRHAALSPIGEPGSSVFILQDVSERKRQEQEQDKHRREQALADMSAVLAHEVRNPLAGLELFASLLAEADLGSECQEWIGHLQHGLRTLAGTVNNVLQFHGAPLPQRARFDLGPLLEGAVSFLEPLARRAKVKLTLRNQLHGVIFSGDRHQLEQVLLNLCLNALSAMPEGGNLALNAVADTEKPGGRREAAITVSDSGPGIVAAHLSEIFKAGFTTHAGSPGLGLAVCQRIVEEHGGTIRVTSRPGQGTDFTVRLLLKEHIAERNC
ncbi:MAG TPA: ATP-binding protein [Candidatus Sulfotelmatobacter sp.]